MGKTAVDLGAGGHFQQVVVDVALNPALRRQFQLLGGKNVALHSPVDYDRRRTYFALNPAFIQNPHHGVLTRVGDNITLYDTFDLEAAGKMQITDNRGFPRNQRRIAPGAEPPFPTSQHG